MSIYYDQHLVAVTYEDRISALPGVELLARSLHRWSPDIELRVYSPLPMVQSLLKDLPKASWVPTTNLVGHGWNIKPIILLQGLTAARRVLWLDTDIVVAGDISVVLDKFPANILIVAEEFQSIPLSGGQYRAEYYGLVAARDVPYAINSGAILASIEHKELLEQWMHILDSDRYQAVQSLPVTERPASAIGDQDVLWGLLVSEQFKDIAVEYFRTGIEIIQHCGANGYHIRQRLAYPLRNPAVLVHMLGRYKPWSFVKQPSLLKDPEKYFHQACFELSPFFEAAYPFAKQLGNPDWLQRRTIIANVFNALFFGNIALRGAPFALAAWAASYAGRRPKR